MTILYKADWQEIADAAANRIKKEDEALDMPAEKEVYEGMNEDEEHKEEQTRHDDSE